MLILFNITVYFDLLYLLFFACLFLCLCVVFAVCFVIYWEFQSPQQLFYYSMNLGQVDAILAEGTRLAPPPRFALG
jgi:cellulose synthase/poly-beta-1,6-N-acetylglucosamine synthase-like glycosyltransferase